MIKSIASLLFILSLAAFIRLPALAANDKDEQAAAGEQKQPKEKNDREKNKDDKPDYRKRREQEKAERDKQREEREKQREERRKEREAAREKDDAEKDKKDEKPSSQQEQLTKAEKKLQDGDIIGAWSLLESISKQDDDEAAAKQAAEHLKQIEAKGQDEVKKAAAIDDPAEAEKQLSALYKKYWRTPVKNALADALKQVKLRKAQQGSGAAAADAGGAGLPPMPAVEGDAAQGDGAGEPAAQNPDDAARMWLIVGNIHRLNGRPAQAADAYRKLVYEYPDSRFTQEARNKLDELEAESSADKDGDGQ